MRSMTGFGVGDARLAEGRIVAEIRSVNQRFLDLRARLPRELADLTPFVEQIARAHLRRGRVELVVHAEGSVSAPSMLDKRRARAAFRDLAELRDELAPGAELPLSLLAALPDLFTPPSSQELGIVRGAVKAAIELAIEAMHAMCDREGEALAVDLGTRCDVFAELTAEVGRAADGAVLAIRKRLRERLERLLTDAVRTLDSTRLETEVVLLADRSDFTEEVTRLKSHVEQFRGALRERSGEPIGRRLDFLLQEMLREVNTVGSKAQDAAISHQVVAMKVELERLREQVQNVE